MTQHQGFLGITLNSGDPGMVMHAVGDAVDGYHSTGHGGMVITYVNVVTAHRPEAIKVIPE